VEDRVSRRIETEDHGHHRWLGENLNLGALHEVSRRISKWANEPDPVGKEIFRRITNHKDGPLFSSFCLQKGQ
jgi:hypothetical protein